MMFEDAFVNVRKIRISARNRREISFDSVNRHLERRWLWLAFTKCLASALQKRISGVRVYPSRIQKKPLSLTIHNNVLVSLFERAPARGGTYQSICSSTSMQLPLFWKQTLLCFHTSFPQLSLCSLLLIIFLQKKDINI